jgi:hypothetical protein
MLELLPQILSGVSAVSGAGGDNITGKGVGGIFNFMKDFGKQPQSNNNDGIDALTQVLRGDKGKQQPLQQQQPMIVDNQGSSIPQFTVPNHQFSMQSLDGKGTMMAPQSQQQQPNFWQRNKIWM